MSMRYVALIADPDVYYDVVDAPDPITFRIRITILNNSGRTLYFQASLVSAPEGFSMDTQNLGSIGNGGKKSFTITIQRTKPSIPFPELVETVTIRISAYTDENYTNLYAYQDIDITFHGIDSSDPNWTIVEDANFDDGSMQGWTLKVDIISGCGGCSHSSIPVTTTYVSPPYSARERCLCSSTACDSWFGITKSFDLSQYTKAYLVLYIRFSSGTYECDKARVYNGERYYIFSLPSLDVWYKVVVPLKLDLIDVIIQAHAYVGAPYSATYYIDSIKIVAI